MEITKKTVCIAGAEGGIGGEIVKELRRDGFVLCIVDKKNLAVPSCDALILNSGIGWFGELENLEDTKLKEMLWVNLERHIILVKSVIKDWKERRKGHFIFIASISAYEGLSGDNVYSGSKAGLLGFARSLAKECRNYGIKVTVISPGTTNTNFWLKADIDNRKKCKPIEPYEIAKAVSFALKIPSVVSEMTILPRAKMNKVQKVDIGIKNNTSKK